MKYTKRRLNDFIIYGYIQDFWRRPRLLPAVPAPIEAWGPECETEEAQL